MESDRGIKTDVELLKKDVSQIYFLLPKLDTAIDKITEMSSGISKMLAVHEEKIANQEQRITDLAEYNKRKKYEEKDVQESFNKKLEQITLENKNDRRENHKEVMKAISDLREDIHKRIEEVKNDTKEDISQLKNRVSSLEKWKWYMMGVAAVIGFILSKAAPAILAILFP